MPVNQFYLTIDIGTTAVKVCLVGRDMKCAYCCNEEYELHARGAEVTCPPETYWIHIKKGIREAVHQKKEGRILGICITSQGETIIPVDGIGTPLHDAVVWLDGRAGKQAEEIKAIVGREEFQQRTGIPECNEFCPVSKILWFREKRPDIYERARYFLLLEDFIIHRLTGTYVTEKSLLSTTGYFDIGRDQMWLELLEKLSIDSEKIPEAKECGELAGSVTPEAAQDLLLSEGLPVVTGAMDQVCAALGAGNFWPGMVTETTGTALCIGETVEKAPIKGRLQFPVYRHYRKDLQLLLPVCMTGGMVLKWFKDNFCEVQIQQALEEGDSVYELLNREAAKSEPLAKGIIMLPYLSGSLQPIYAPAMKGEFLHISLNCKKQDFIRALYEGVGYMLKENLLLLEELGGHPIEEIISMGGGSKSDIWCEIKAAITEKKIFVEKESETASIGAAMLCAMGIGNTGDFPQLMEREKSVRKCYLPQKELTELYKKGYKRYQRDLKSCAKEVGNDEE